jgi:hypothetical protein
VQPGILHKNTGYRRVLKYGVGGHA